MCTYLRLKNKQKITNKKKSLCEGDVGELAWRITMYTILYNLYFTCKSNTNLQ